MISDGDSDDPSGALRSDCLWCSHILHCVILILLILEDVLDPDDHIFCFGDEDEKQNYVDGIDASDDDDDN